LRINWKLADRECATSLTRTDAYRKPSKDFRRTFRTRLESKVGTMTGETSPGNDVRGAFKWRNAEPEKRFHEVDPRDLLPSAKFV